MVSEIKADPAVLDQISEPATSQSTAHVYERVTILERIISQRGFGGPQPPALQIH